MKALAEKLRYHTRKIRGKYRPKGNDSFFKEVSGVLHVGANIGQERYFYYANKIQVLWIEPIPIVFAKLVKNIRALDRQIAFDYLLADKNGLEVDFHITNNGGESSSIFHLDKHKLLWPDVHHDNTIKLPTMRLDTMIEIEKINLEDYDTLILDTQGSELLVLSGAESIINKFKYIKLEVADFDSYAGNCTLKEINLFMQDNSFIEISRNKFAQHSVGNYYDITYIRKN